jgi:ParB family chromosome partitioning protein
MGRKNLLDGLMGEGAAPELTAVNSAPRAARPAGGAIGAVGASIAELRANAVVELDPHLIEAGGLEDRLEDDPEADAALMASIEAHGQQVPVLVRPHETEEGRYRIVYGRRRVLVARDLGLPVKALVRDLDAAAAVMAQGQENSQRRDLSFIEKAHFARQMRDAGYGRAAICDAVNVDKTVISRMLSVVDRLPVEVVVAIGSAPGIGRDRWLALAERYEASGWAPEAAAALAVAPKGATGPDARFEALMTALARPKPAAAPRGPSATRRLEGSGGRALGTAALGAKAVTLRLETASAEGFADWLIERMPELHRDWLATRED